LGLLVLRRVLLRRIKLAGRLLGWVRRLLRWRLLRWIGLSRRLLTLIWLTWLLWWILHRVSNRRLPW
jgi:hypothetical protein